MSIDPLFFFLLLGIISWVLLSSAPESVAARRANREARAQRRTTQAAEKAQRQAWRRRVFGSHPVLYGALCWLSAPVVVSLVAAFMGR